MKDHPDMKDYQPADLILSSFLATNLLKLMNQENLTLDSIVERHKAEIRDGNLSAPIFIAMKFFEAAPRVLIKCLMVQAITAYEHCVDQLPRKHPWKIEIYEDVDNDIAVSFY